MHLRPALTLFAILARTRKQTLPPAASPAMRSTCTASQSTRGAILAARSVKLWNDLSSEGNSALEMTGLAAAAISQLVRPFVSCIGGEERGEDAWTQFTCVVETTYLNMAKLWMLKCSPGLEQRGRSSFPVIHPREQPTAPLFTFFHRVFVWIVAHIKELFR